MFTGIIQLLGTAILNGSKLLVDYSDMIVKDLKIGDSIAINGINTTFGMVKNGVLFAVNIERSIKNNEEFGGHIVQGHIHDIGKIMDIQFNLDNSKDVWITCNKMENIKYKDSIAIDGVSLTIAEVFPDQFRISLIPHTLNNTTFGTKKIGDMINIEYNINQHQPIEVSDEYYMKLAYKESKKGRLTTAPNPWVGCVIIHKNNIVGRGYHLKAGTPHAEINAINNAIENGYQSNLSECELYVTLEPCHQFKGKRTCACDTFICDYKFKRVIIGMLDPDPNVTGLGVETLKKNGIEVTIGVLEEKIKVSLRSYIHHRMTGFPYVIIKTALSMDGFPCLNNNDSKWITSEESRKHAHKIRSQSQAIIIGNNTIISDNPKLNVRLDNLPKDYIQPLRVIIDRFGKIKQGNILDVGISGTLMITSHQIDASVLDVWKSKKVNYEVLTFKDGKLVLSELLELLGRKGILQCLIEGGPFLHDEFLINDLYQEIHIYYGNLIMGSNGKKWSNKHNTVLDEICRHKLLKVKKINNDCFMKYIQTRTPSNGLDGNIETAISNLQKGKPIILMDDEERENEGDLVIGAEFMTPELCLFFVQNTTGMICVPMEEKRAKFLNLSKMVELNQDPNGTPFTVSCDHKSTKTGVSIIDRTMTITKLADYSATKDDFMRPGHMSPLIASKGGIYERQGHTEGSIELCKLANIKPIAAIAELMNKDGTMMNYDDYCNFAQRNNLVVVTMKELKKHLQLGRSLRAISSCELQTKFGLWELICYSSEFSSQPHKVLIKGNIYKGESILMRIHSECFTGDVLGSRLCDCGDQLELSMRMISENGIGLIIFPANHEGRGIGLHNKVLAYRKMKNSGGTINTYQANKLLGFPEDARNYDCVIDILNDLGIDKIDLLTQNIDKITSLKSRTNRIIPLKCIPNEFNINYLQTKEEKNGIISILKSKINYVNESFNINIDECNNLKIGIIYTIWNGDIINDFISQLEKEALGLNIMSIKKWTVPGSFEIPYLAQKIIKLKEVDILICVGTIIKGDTANFEYISSSVINALMDIQVKMEFPIINGVLNCYNKEQAIERFKPENGLAKSLILSALHMIT